MSISLEQIDHAADAQTAHWEHLKSLVSQDAVWDAFKAHLDLISNSRSQRPGENLHRAL